MGKELYDQSRMTQEFFEQASTCLDINFTKLCFASSDKEISTVDKGYLAIVLLECALYAELAQRGLRPDFVAGYGIGEYAAAFASGSLNFADTLYILNKFSQFYKEFIDQQDDFTVLRLVRGFDYISLQELCVNMSDKDHEAYISSHNTPEGFYVAGHKKVIQKIEEYCKDQVIRKVRELGVAYGLHNKLVQPVVDRLVPYFNKVDFMPLKTPVITNVDGSYVTSPEALQAAVIQRITSPVMWHEVMESFVGCDVLIVVGPGRQVLEWAQEKYPDKEFYAISDYDELKMLDPLLIEQRAEFGISLPGDAQHIDHFKPNVGQCRFDDTKEKKPLPENLSDADEVNEHPDDYDPYFEDTE
jgi:[acyl-carrier-protein] S-malonyltransferase